MNLDDPFRGPHATAFPSGEEQTEGLSKHEWFAGMALSGLLAASTLRVDQRPLRDLDNLAEVAVAAADALVLALAPPPTTTKPAAVATDAEPGTCDECGAPCDAEGCCTKDRQHCAVLPF